MLSALGFLTILGGSRPPGRATPAWFPAVGALLGALVALAHRLAHDGFSPLVAAAVVLTVEVVLTGALHLDGLADSADGLLPHMARDRRLEVMSEPTLGTFAAVALVVTLLLRVAVFAESTLEPETIVALWAGARGLAGAVPAFVDYARPGGLASAFLGASKLWPAASLVPVAALAILGAGAHGAAATAGLVVGAVGVVALARRRLGGFTGDVLGASIVVGETVGLLALVTLR